MFIIIWLLIQSIIHTKNKEPFNLLLSKNIDINAPYKDISPLQIAASSDRDGYFVKQLLSKKAYTAYCEPTFGRNVLFFAHSNAIAVTIPANISKISGKY